MSPISPRLDLGLCLRQPGDALPVIVGVTEGHLTRIGPLQVEVHIVVPRVADAAVDMDALKGRLLVGLPSLGQSVP